MYNVTRQELPDATVEFYDYGAAYWLPTGSTDGCFNFAGCNVRGNGPGVPGASCPDGMCTSLGFAMNETFLVRFTSTRTFLWVVFALNNTESIECMTHQLANDPMFVGFALSLYWPYEPDFSRRMFASAAANANAAGLRGRRNVKPTVSLGSAYMRNQSLWPNINAQENETLRGPGFFDMPFAFHSPGYDLSYSMLLGAQINQPRFNRCSSNPYKINIMCTRPYSYR